MQGIQHLKVAKYKKQKMTVWYILQILGGNKKEGEEKRKIIWWW